MTTILTLAHNVAAILIMAARIVWAAPLTLVIIADTYWIARTT
jgi:hypothetical protein